MAGRTPPLPRRSLANRKLFRGRPPYRCESVSVDGVGVGTNNPPCGAMRGFGSVQVCFGYEAQMDRLAVALGMDPLDLRELNASPPVMRCPPPGRSSKLPFPQSM